MASPSVLKSTEPDHVKVIVAMKGAGAAVPTVESAANGGAGAGVTLTRNGAAGDITVTFTEVPGVYLGQLHSFDANSEADVDGWTVHVDRDGSTAKTVRFIINNEAQAAADLPTNSWLYLELNFRRANVRG